MGAASWEAYKVIKEKRKYWYKTLSNEAIGSTLLSTIGIFDWLSFFGDITLSDTIFTSLVSMLLYDIPLIELSAWNIDWRIELPDLEEFLQGVLLKVIAIDVSDIIEEYLPDMSGIESDVDQLIQEVLESTVAEEVINTRLRKGVYDKTTYGNSYYDPPAVRDFLRSSFYFEVKRPITIETAKSKLDAAKKTLNIKEENAVDLFNRSQLMEAAKVKTLTFDYGWWDYSYWDYDGERTVKIKDYNGNEVELEYEDLFDVVAGGFWDYANWDYFHWVDGTEQYKHPWKTDTNPIFLIRDKLVEHFRDRITSTPYLIANYLRREEREKFTPSDRLEVYALTDAHRKRIENMVKRLLSSIGVSVAPVVQRLYITAALQLYSLRYSDNKQGIEMYKRMSEDEFKNYWIEYWSKQGLDINVLERIYNEMKDVINMYGFIRTREKIRFIRKKLRMVRGYGV